MPTNYISTLKYDVFTPAYDFLIANFLREKTFKNGLLGEIQKTPSAVLDIGCGTATLSSMIK